MISVGHVHLGWREELPEAMETFCDLIADSPPAYRLPPATATHSRHYMPYLEGSKQNTTKVIDSHLRIDSGQPLWIGWTCQLPETVSALVEELFGLMGYLGRAESWIDATSHRRVPDGGVWHMATHQDEPSLDGIPTRLLGPIRNDDYVAWRGPAVGRALQAETDGRGKKLTKSQTRKIESKFPDSRADALMVDTGWLQSCGWSRPPGSRWLEYFPVVRFTEDDRPDETAAASVAKRSLQLTGHQISRATPSRATNGEAVTWALLKLTSDSVSGRTLPPEFRTVWIGEALHDAAAAESSRRWGRPLDRLTGKFDPPLDRQHGHAHFLSLDLDRDRRIDHVLVHCPAKITDELSDVLRRVRAIYSTKLPRIHVNWVGQGTASDFERAMRREDVWIRGLMEPVTELESRTPFVASRHLKGHRYTIEDNVRDECRFRGLPEPKIEILGNGSKGKYAIMRTKEGRQPPAKDGYHVRLCFPVSIAGPLCLGYASHFGLGWFARK